MADPIMRRKEAVSGRAQPEPDVSGMTDRYLDCREVGHSWERPSFGLAEPVQMGSTRSRRLANQGRLGRRFMECSRCTCQREDYVSRATGELISRRYTYPEGYLIKGQGRPRADALRKERFERALGSLKEVLRKHD